MKTSGKPFLALVLLAGLPFARPAGVHHRSLRIHPGTSLAHTYSIIAIDPEHDEMGFAVQSHWFNVGSVVGWAEAGVGVVATQSLVDISYGPLGLELMRGGKPAPAALQALLTADEGRELRQVAMLDVEGRIAAHTGKRCIPEAGHIVGKRYSVQANLMEKPTVWPAMARAFETAGGDLADRMMAALEAAQKEGGDIRGRQSAAMKIVRIRPRGPAWKNVRLDLRVDDHPQPLRELRRLLTVHRGYDEMNAGDLALEKNDFQAAMEHYEKASRMLSGNLEPRFWQAVGLVQAHRVDEALRVFREVFARDRKWWVLLQRLPQTGLFPQDEELWKRLHQAFDANDPR